MSSNYSDSESDNEAPEEVSLSTAKKGTKEAAKKAKDSEIKVSQAKKAKNRAADAKLKAAKGKGKEKASKSSAPVEDEEEEEVQEGIEGEEEDDSEETSAPSSSTKLDPSLFASAAAFYEQPALDNSSKHALKRKIRAEKSARAIVAKERAGIIGEGGQRELGDRTIQHLPLPTQTTPSLASTALPSHTSATKFLANRLYSKKRAISVLAGSQPKNGSGGELSGRKRVKVGGGMSDESKILLGIPLTGSGGKGESEAEKAKSKKRTLLLTAEGRRKPATNARPLASSKARGGPAAKFAVSTRTR